MQLIPIVLVAAVVLAADDGPAAGAVGWRPDGAMAALLAIGPVLLALLAARTAVGVCRRRLATRGDVRSIGLAERWVRICRWLIVVNHVAAVLLLGWLAAVRRTLGDPVLLDELLAMLPALAGLAGTWWVYYPVERRMREALLIRSLDDGEPLFPIPSRGRYVMLQMQVHILLLLAPILLILAASELIDAGAARLPEPGVAPWVVDVATVAAALAIFVLSPLLARLVLSLAPLGAGPLRDQLLTICDRHGVRVREVLVWSTCGTMINAAVMGLLRPFRYVLLTDALIETVPGPYVLAVMAHEIGHVRRRHMPWLVITLMATLILAVLAIAGALAIVEATGLGDPLHDLEWLDVAATALELVAALLVFGWVCRRFERQADTFAVQHLSGLGGRAPAADAGPRIEPGAVATMRGALDTIARLNAVDPDRPSWRHGSIAWRRAYLEDLVGKPAVGLAIDRVIGRIKLAAMIVLLAGGGLIAAQQWWWPASEEGGVLTNERAGPGGPRRTASGARRMRSTVSTRGRDGAPLPPLAPAAPSCLGPASSS
jgi:Zn-dependent protease with chaperone function